jgi:hypothetical protein
MAAAAEQHQINLTQFLGRWYALEKVDHLDRRNVTPKRASKTADFLWRHRIARIARLQQKTSNFGHKPNQTVLPQCGVRLAQRGWLLTRHQVNRNRQCVH